jgi:hypothetical protein
MRPTNRKSLIRALGLLVTLWLPASSAAHAQRAVGIPLSDGRTFTHWAHAGHKAAARLLPSQSSPLVARLHFLTEDGFPEVYPVLRRFKDRGGDAWLRVQIARRPQRSTGWVRASALGPVYRVQTHLVVDRGLLRATLYRAGRRIWRSAIGVGKAGTATPAGLFWIREKFKVADPSGAYGPQAFGTSGYSRLSDWPGGGVVGIHGTNEPNLIPGRPSHGCIRIPNEAISRLYQLMPIGTPVQVR